MISKGHTSIGTNTDEQEEELEPFYDYTQSYKEVNYWDKWLVSWLALIQLWLHSSGLVNVTNILCRLPRHLFPHHIFSFQINLKGLKSKALAALTADSDSSDLEDEWEDEKPEENEELDSFFARQWEGHDM